MKARHCPVFTWINNYWRYMDKQLFITRYKNNRDKEL